jgi:hypothetical protein
MALLLNSELRGIPKFGGSRTVGERFPCFGQQSVFQSDLSLRLDGEWVRSRLRRVWACTGVHGRTKVFAFGQRAEARRIEAANGVLALTKQVRVFEMVDRNVHGCVKRLSGQLEAVD